MPDAASESRSAARPGHLRAVPGGLAQPSATLSLLQAVGEDLRRTWEPTLEESFEPGEVERVVGWLVEGIDACCHDEEVPLPAMSLALTRFLLERMNTGLAAALAADTRFDREGVLQLLGAVGQLRARIEPAWDRYFASQITGPDGLNVVTEVLHDIRSPLTSIRCLAELLERGQSGPVTEIQQKQLRLIYSAALGMGTMAGDVIEMARQREHLTEGERVAFSLSEMLEGVAALVRPIAEEKGLRVSYQQLPTDQRVGLPHPLGRVLLNLVTNALKFTDVGGVEIRVRTSGLSRVEFSVVDTGRGIPAESIPNLYRPFRRSLGRQGRSGFLFSGTGLGLALCRKLLRSMDSELHLETAEGEGTRFYFELELPPISHL